MGEARVSQERKHQRAYAALLDGDLAGAATRYRAILAGDPHDAVAWHHLALCLFQAGDLADASEAVEKSLKIQELSASALHLLALIRTAMGDDVAAADALERSLRINPNNAQGLNDLGNIHLQRGDPASAAALFLKATEQDPQVAISHYNLGVALQQSGQIDAAIQAFENAIVLKAEFAEAHCNLGLALVEVGRLDDGIVAYQRAIQIRPDFPEAYANLAKPLVDQRRMEEAGEALRRAIEQRPDFAVAVENYGAIKRLTGELTEALELFERALALNPSNAKLRIDQINLRRLICDWRHYHEDQRDLRAMPASAEPFIYMNSSAGAAEQLICARAWAARLPRLERFRHTPRKRRQKLRIGYLSADFRRHATAYLMAELIERHDRARFEIFAYSYGYDDDSDERRRLMAAFDHFVDLEKASHQEAAQRIFDDRIDILIDLKGYTGGARTQILTGRPAPIQVNYLGFPGGMGADFIDYVIADRTIAPLTHQPFYDEAIVHLPGCYQPNDTKRKTASRTFSRADFGLPDDGFVFCSFNGAYKVTPDIFDVWMRLLKHRPGSVLWLLRSAEAVEGNLRKEAAARGVDPERLVFSPPLDLPEHLARHALADLFLDSLPINAHTTASDALWAGLPVLTALGDSFSSRVAASLLNAVGLPELVSPSMADYEASALALSSDAALLQSLRRRLADNLPSAPLFDIAAYTRHLEAAFLEMWEIYASGGSPRPIVVKAAPAR